MNRTLVWFRRDLRVSDHEPLYRAARRGEVVPVFVFDRALLLHPETGAGRVAFMLSCLAALDADLRQLGGRLILRAGDPVQVLPRLVKDIKADGIYCHTDCERIYGRVRDARLNRAMAEAGLRIRWFEPAASRADLVSYPDYRTWWHREMGAPTVPTPARVSVPADIASEPLPALSQLEHQADGKPIPLGGSGAARRCLREFLDHKRDRYYWQLSYPSAQATTGLSPHIKFGTLSVREAVQTIWQAAASEISQDGRSQRSDQQLAARLRWGSGFAQRFRYLPQLEVRSLYQVFDDDGWAFDQTLYAAWQTGQTGFPIVDAAARCLQATGGYLALNFRVRAIYASFLSNLLGIDWRWGALHFMRHLIDGDCPIDHYQWAMQSGVTHCVDKTWTRIYNPGQTAVDRCDPEGQFIKQWVPELAHLPPERLGSPPAAANYPDPIVDYRQARARRVEQLDRQRRQFRFAENIVPHLSRLPADVTPFGADPASEVTWARELAPDLFPTALELNQLDLQQAQALRTWFVAHVDIRPPKIRSRSRPARRSAEVNQLSLQV